MGVSTNYTKSYPDVIPYGDPTIFGSPGLTKSLCLQHPIYGECPLAHKSHECDQCEQCAVYGRGKCEDPLTWEPPPPIQPPSYRELEMHDCGMPWCDRQSKAKYCRSCATLVNCRRHSWKKTRDGDAPKWYLHREREYIRRSNQPSVRKYDYHPDDAPFAPMLFYPSKLDKAKALGYESVSDCIKKLYAEHGSLRIVGKIFGMSGQGIRQQLFKMGVEPNSRGGARR
jgi:hypothetical protein